MTNPTLKPCPFCGGKSESKVRMEAVNYEPSDCYVGWQISCQKCSASIIIYDENAYDREKQKELEVEAIKAWNKRAEIK